MNIAHVTVDGMIAGKPNAIAEKYLEGKVIGDRVYISAMNGFALFVKVGGGVQEADAAEYERTAHMVNDEKHPMQKIKHK